MRRRIVVAVAVCAVVAACGGPADSGDSPSAGVSPSGAATQPSRSTPTAPSFAEARALPAAAATWNPVQQPDGSFITEAVSSGSIEVGIPYRYLIGTHCGITVTTFDVGGSFWDPIADPSTFRLAEPEDAGTFVLLGAGEALWTSSTGYQVRLARGEPGPRQVFFCD
jgi:hypothetical protein